MMGFGLLIPIILIAVIAYAIGWRPGQNVSFGAANNQQTPMEILKERYARGEINRQQYEEMRQELQ